VLHKTSATESHKYKGWPYFKRAAGGCKEVGQCMYIYFHCHCICSACPPFFHLRNYASSTTTYPREQPAVEQYAWSRSTRLFTPRRLRTAEGNAPQQNATCESPTKDQLNISQALHFHKHSSAHAYAQGDAFILSICLYASCTSTHMTPRLAFLFVLIFCRLLGDRARRSI
jgi:hypothetical protein